MLNNINRKINSGSVLEKINPLIKLILILTLMIFATKINNYKEMIFLLVITVVIIFISKIPVIFLHKQILFISYFIIMFSIMGIFAHESIKYYLFISTKFYITFILIFIYSFTTDMFYFSEQLNKFLKLFISKKKRTNFIFNLLMTITVIPLIANVFEEIKNAQKLRGLKINIFTYPYLLIPLIMQIDEIAYQLYQTYTTRKLTSDDFIEEKKFIFNKKEFITIISITLIIFSEFLIIL